MHYIQVINEYKLIGKVNKQLKNIFNYILTDVQNWERANLWSLIQDNEYVLSKFYSATDVFPTLMGKKFSISNNRKNSSDVGCIAVL